MNPRDRVSYTVPEAEVATGIAANSIRAAIRSGQLVSRWPLPGKQVIPADELHRWINEAPSERPTS